jgi:hypothetical protein
MQVYILKKSHYAASSVERVLHREVIWRQIWQHIPERKKNEEKKCKECWAVFPPNTSIHNEEKAFGCKECVAEFT